MADSAKGGALRELFCVFLKTVFRLVGLVFVFVVCVFCVLLVFIATFRFSSPFCVLYFGVSGWWASLLLFASFHSSCRK